MLSALYDAINTELTLINGYAQLVWDEEQIALHSPPPSFIVTPSDDQFDSVKHSAGNPRALATVWEGALLTIRGETRDIVQGMRDQFVCALHQALKKSAANTAYAGQYRLSAGQWTRKQFLTANGFEYTIKFATIVAILKRVWPATVPPTPPTPDTYVGVLTYPVVPGDQITAVVNVGYSDNDSENPVVTFDGADED